MKKTSLLILLLSCLIGTLEASGGIQYSPAASSSFDPGSTQTITAPYVFEASVSLKDTLYVGTQTALAPAFRVDKASVTIGNIDGSTYRHVPLMVSTGTSSNGSIYFSRKGGASDVHIYGSPLGVGVSHSGSSAFFASAADVTFGKTILAPSGLVGTPSVAFSANTDNGFYMPDANKNQWAAVVGGARRMELCVSSTVFTGWTNINGSAGASTILFSVSTGASNIFAVYGTSINLGVPLYQNVEGADYVFEPDYKHMSIEECMSFTKSRKHLPGFPDAEETRRTDTATLLTKTIEKLEEAHLYIFDLNNRLKEMEKRMKKMEKTK